MNILFRRLFNDDEEIQIAKKHCNVCEYRTQVSENSLIIGRYSVLPYYKELEIDLSSKGSKSINTYQEHRYIADICNYYEDIKEYTPKTYTTWGNLPEGQWVLKGKTNSRKHQWNTHMFAKSTKDIKGVVHKLLDDPLISEQGIVVREYVPLKTFGIGINGVPITKEFRCFFYKDEFLVGDYYWSEHPEHYQPLPNEGKEFAIKVAKKLKERTSFFVIDIAETVRNEWIVIEVNDGQMSGLSCNDPDRFYKKLQELIS